MFVSEEVQKARKKAQLARLKMKGTPEYAAMYAAQPDQVRIAKEQKAARKARREAREALAAAALGDAGGTVSVFEGSIDLTGGEN